MRSARASLSVALLGAALLTGSAVATPTAMAGAAGSGSTPLCDAVHRAIATASPTSDTFRPILEQLKDRSVPKELRRDVARLRDAYAELDAGGNTEVSIFDRETRDAKRRIGASVAKRCDATFEATSAPDYLYVVDAASVSASVEPGGNTAELHLASVDPETLRFSDRPVRQADSIATQDFVASWADLGFEADPPNAALVVADGPAGQKPRAAELTDPTFDEAAGTLDVALTALGPEGLEWLRLLTSDTASANGDVTLFIDDAGSPQPVGNYTTTFSVDFTALPGNTPIQITPRTDDEQCVVDATSYSGNRGPGGAFAASVSVTIRNGSYSCFVGDSAQEWDVQAGTVLSSASFEIDKINGNLHVTCYVNVGHCLPNKPGGTDTHSVSFAP